MTTKATNKEAIEEYAPGPGHPHTLDGYADWSRWRDAQEAAKRERAREAEFAALKARTGGDA